MKPSFAPPRRARGIALLEVLIAVVVLGIGLVGLVGMQTRAYVALADAGNRAEATIAADKLVGIMSADQANVANYAVAGGGAPGPELTEWLADTQARVPGAVVSVVVAAASPTMNRVDLIITWPRKGVVQTSTSACTTTVLTNTKCGVYALTTYIAEGT
jgi:type IV pilus assembly protein PilV